VDSSKIEQAFGLKATPLRDAICETVQWFRMYRRGEEKEDS
jgi:hypothetical protein